MSDESERVSVQTYVPRYQKELWAEDAERMEMTQSEFVRTMVQAGRSEFELPSPNESGKDSGSDQTANGGGDGVDLPERVLELLSEEPREWDELVTALTDDIEAELDRTLDELQGDDIVRYSGRHGGYVIHDVE